MRRRPTDEHYFSYSPAHARRLAAEARFSCRTFKADNSRKAPWLVLLSDLAAHLDARRDEALKERSCFRNAS
ncbi:MAG: pyocin activator PrtN family protein [Aquisalimonadaceae bacterium]